VKIVHVIASFLIASEAMSQEHTPLIQLPLSSHIISITNIDKKEIGGVFGNFSLRPAIPVNYELCVGVPDASAEIKIQAERFIVNNISACYNLRKLSFNICIDNLFKKTLDPPTFEQIGNNTIPLFDLVSGTPKTLKLSATFNF
jgi:hypothetical protein